MEGVNLQEAVARLHLCNCVTRDQKATAARALLRALHVEQKQNKGRQQTKSVCLLPLNHIYAQQRMKLSDTRSFVLLKTWMALAMHVWN